MIFEIDISVILKYQTVYQRFLELAHRFGLRYKKLSRLIMDDSIAPAALWQGRSDDDGDVRIRTSTEPQTIAHELGHGVFEKYGYFGAAVYSEAFANAVRWLIEKQVDQHSPWFDQFTTNSDKECRKAHFILEKCQFDMCRFAEFCNREAEMKKIFSAMDAMKWD